MYSTCETWIRVHMHMIDYFFRFHNNSYMKMCEDISNEPRREKKIFLDSPTGEDIDQPMQMRKFSNFLCQLLVLQTL